MVAEQKIYQAYYTKSNDIVAYMLELLDCEMHHKILEPCAGDGVFIDGILSEVPQAAIDAYELNTLSFNNLTEKYSAFNNISITHSDTLTDSNLALQSHFGGIYDRIIANPPYGAWQDYSKRDNLKKSFPNLYVKETYALFLYQSIQLLKENGRLVFIIPDTFLTLHLHKYLRQYILTHAQIDNITLFPSSFFPNVNFGYANLCIISLTKCSSTETCLNNTVTIRSQFKEVSELNTGNGVFSDFIQSDFYENKDHAFYFNRDVNFQILSKSDLCIGDIAHCVTGFYSGNDKEFLKTNAQNHRNAKYYPTIQKVDIASNYLDYPDLLNGIPDENAHYIPIMKGGNKPFYKPDDWFMNWSQSTVAFYKKDKKARFQNPSYYFNNGVGIPMVSASSITAALLHNRLFDQSIVGVFPHDEALILYILAFFNTPIANSLIRTINNSTNNSANYIKKMPFIRPIDADIEIVSTFVKDILRHCETMEAIPPFIQKEINIFFESKYREVF
jgi:adenine-specific DNA-methyltransferase